MSLLLTSIFLTGIVIFILIRNNDKHVIFALKAYAKNADEIENFSTDIFEEITSRKIKKKITKSIDVDTLNKHYVVVKVVGDCMREHDIIADNYLLVKRIQQEECKIKNNILFYGDIKVDPQKYLLYNYTQNKKKNSEYNFKIRRFKEFTTKNGKQFVVSTKQDKNNKEREDIHTPDMILGIVMKNLTTNIEYYPIA